MAHAAKSRLPTVYAWRDAVEAGGLRLYATNFPEMYRRAAIYVDKILKGVGRRPADRATDALRARHQPGREGPRVVDSRVAAAAGR